jgi:isoleucyl-tRNA synthetase
MIPFLSEEIYTDLTGESSVHLSSWPEELIKEIDESLIKDMDSVRNIVEVGHRVRKELKLKVRQPLAKVYVKVPQKYAFVLSDYRDPYINLIKEELNVKDVQYSSAKIEDFKIEYDADLTDELILEGKLRDLIRSIQSERKKQGIMIDQKVDITIPEIFKDNLEVIKKSIYTEKITFGEQISVR